jgi:hypothetical protein
MSGSGRGRIENEQFMFKLLTAFLHSSAVRRGMLCPRAAVKHLAKLSPIADIAPTDIILAAYPRSGATWLQNLLAGLLYGVDPELTPYSVIESLVPDLHQTQFFRRHEPVCCVKSHVAPQPTYRRVVHLLRDGRDVVVSYRHFLAAMEQREVAYTELVGPTATVWPCRWHEHTEAWLRNPYGAEILSLRFEELLRDPVSCLRQLCAFAGLERDEAFLQRVAESVRFSKLKVQESRFGHGGYANGMDFFRRGIIGSHRDEMPPDVLAVFLAEAGPALRRCGYATGQVDDAQRAA